MVTRSRAKTRTPDVAGVVDGSSPARASCFARMSGGRPVFGAAVTTAGPSAAELAIACGYDFVMLDCEHGDMGEAAHRASLEAISAAGGFSAVRLPPDGFELRSGDLVGHADAILLSDVRNATAAQNFVVAANSMAGSEPAAPAPLLLALIESIKAVDDVEAIARTAGLNGLVIGPNGLAESLGHDFGSDAYQSAFARIEAAARDFGLILGSRPHPGYPMDRLIAQGHTFLLATVDVWALRSGLEAHLAQVRGTLR